MGKKDKKDKKDSKSAIERTFATNILLRKRADVLNKRLMAWKDGSGDQGGKIVETIEQAGQQVSDIIASSEALSELLGKLDKAGFVPKTAGASPLEPDVPVFIRVKNVPTYSEAYPKDALSNLAVDRITADGKVVVRIGKKGSDKVFIAPRAHLTTISP